MKKIFVLQPNFNAISEVWLDRMTELLQDHIIGIAAYNPSAKNWRNKIPVYDLLKPRYSFLQRLLMKIKLSTPHRTLLEKQLLFKISKADILLVHYINTAVDYLNMLSKTNIPIFVHVHGFDVFIDTIEIGGKYYFDSDYKDKILELSNRVTFISNSRFTTNKLLNLGIPPDKIMLKYFGVPNQNARIWHNQNSVNILFLGRLVDFKRPDIVIKAFIKACDGGLNGQLIVAGDGPFRVTCELLKMESQYGDRITITGAVDYNRAEDLYKWADIYSMHSSFGIFSNNEEAFGVSLIEAMSFGLPIVTANGGAITEIVENGVTGFIVKQNDIDEHADAFLKLYHNRELLSQMGKNAQLRQMERFTIQIEQNRLFEIFKLTN